MRLCPETRVAEMGIAASALGHFFADGATGPSVQPEEIIRG
jgi:hypothetical protein